jgi:GH35 family endo-1,4-beta-xylanase
MKRIILLSFFVFLGLLHAEDPVLPAGAVALLPDTPLKASNPAAAEGKVERKDVPNAPTSQVWRLESMGKLDKTYNVSVSRTFTEPVAQGQICLFVIKARAVETSSEDGKARVSVAVQNTTDYPNSPLWRGWVLGKEWETTFFAFPSATDLPANAGVAKINAGEAKQVIEVADFQIDRVPLGFDLSKAPRMKQTYAGRELDAAWRKGAEERIAALRKGQWTIRVVDAAGQPVTGAKITVRMQRHLFGFGSAVDVNLLSGLGTKFSSQDQAKYRAVTDELFSRIVPENGLRVGNIDAEPDPQKPWEVESRRRTGVAVEWTLQWAQDHKMSTRGHYLAWGYLENWARDIVKARGTAGLLDTYDRHFRFVIPFCQPYVEEWDALNHPVPFAEADALYNVIGPDAYPDIYRKIRPLTDKRLFVNEDTFNPDRTAAFEKHIQHMIAKGATPDGCGFQSHFSDYAIPSIEAEWADWERFGKLVKYLTVTEYDFQTLDDQLHADHLRDMLTLSFSHPQMTGFVMWGFWEQRHWKPTAALFHSDWSERPAVQVWRDLVKGKWWTNADLTTNANGEAPLEAFFGWYDIALEKDGCTTQATVKHNVSGGRPVLTLK